MIKPVKMALEIVYMSSAKIFIYRPQNRIYLSNTIIVEDHCKHIVNIVEHVPGNQMKQTILIKALWHLPSHRNVI